MATASTNPAVYEVPLAPASQTLNISLGGVTYSLRVLWNEPAQCWVMNINDVNDNPVVTGIALKTGVDLLGQFGYLNFGGSLYVQTDFDPLADPTYQNLGSSSHLYFVVTQP